MRTTAVSTSLEQILLRRFTPEQLARELARETTRRIRVEEDNLRLQVENFWLALGKTEQGVAYMKAERHTFADWGMAIALGLMLACFLFLAI